MYLRTIKVRSSNGTVHEYVRIVEAHRLHGQIKQHTVAELGRKDLLRELLPKLQRLLGQAPTTETAQSQELDILDASTWGPVLAVRTLFDQLGLWTILDSQLGKAKGVPFTDRAFVLIANRLIQPSSEHGWATWLETEFVCDRRGRRFLPHWHTRGRVRVHFRQLEAWYRTLDQLLGAKEDIELALYRQLRDLFSLQPDLILYDITSTYFEGGGPTGFAKHGYSRDGQPHNVQVVVGIVMVAGWPIAHHVFAGNRRDQDTVQEVVRDLHQRFGFQRVVFVGDRGMVTEENVDALTAAKHGYLVGVKRRRNRQINRWLAAVDEAKWIACPVGITARERGNPPRTRAQEVASGVEGMRVIVVDSDERRAYEQAMRQRSMERTRERLEKLRFIRRKRALGLKNVEMLTPLGVVSTDSKTERPACPPACCIRHSASAATSTSAPTTEVARPSSPSARIPTTVAARPAAPARSSPVATASANSSPCPSAPGRRAWPCRSRGSNVGPVRWCARSRSPSPNPGGAPPNPSSDPSWSCRAAGPSSTSLITWMSAGTWSKIFRNATCCGALPSPSSSISAPSPSTRSPSPRGTAP